MRKIILSIALLLSTLAVAAQELTSAQIKGIQKTIDIIASGDKSAISKIIQYPLERTAPFKSIKNQQEFMQRFDEVFDTELIDMISSTSIDDWSEVGWRGYTFGTGDVWLDSETYKIIGVNKETSKAEKLRTALIEKDRKQLPASLRDFVAPVFTIRTKTYHIRIDEMADGSLRYASWKIKKTTGEPDIIVHNGTVTEYSTSGNHTMKFINKNYTYQIDIIYMGKGDGNDAQLTVFQNNKQLLKQAGKIIK